MAVASLPAIAKIRELRLGVKTTDADVTRPINRKAPYAASMTEIWQGDILFAALTEANTHALAAFLEARDGRVEPFKVSLAAGKFGALATHTAALQAVPALGADVVRLNLSPASGTLKAGTLFTVGDIETDAFQMFEVLADVAASSNTAVQVAPRVGRTFAIDAAVVVGTVDAKLKLASDDFASAIAISHGTVSISVVEAL